MIETAEEQRNRIATDIISCPKCGCEDFEILSINHDKKTMVTTCHCQCKECGTKIKEEE